MPTLTLHNRRLFYADHRPESTGPALLLLHGAGGSHLIWPGPLRRLPTARVVALDLPGHGRSDPPGRRDIGQYAADVSEFIDELRLPEVVIVGHSMGGAIAMAMASHSTRALRGLVLLGTSARMPVTDSLLVGTIESLERTAAILDEAGFAKAPAEMRRRLREGVMATGTTTTYGDFLACNRFDARSRLAGIDLPVLVICGSQDRLIPPRFMASLAEGLPNSRLARVEGAGHYAMLEQPDEVTRLIDEFLHTLHKPRQM